MHLSPPVGPVPRGWGWDLARRVCAWRCMVTNCEVTGSDPDLVIEVVQVVSGEQDGTVLIPSRLATEIIRSFDQGR